MEEAIDKMVDWLKTENSTRAHTDTGLIWKHYAHVLAKARELAAEPRPTASEGLDNETFHQHQGEIHHKGKAGHFVIANIARHFPEDVRKSWGYRICHALSSEAQKPTDDSGLAEGLRDCGVLKTGGVEFVRLDTVVKYLSRLNMGKALKEIKAHCSEVADC